MVEANGATRGLARSKKIIQTKKGWNDHRKSAFSWAPSLAVLDLSDSLALSDVSQLARVHTLVLRNCPNIANLHLVQPHVRNLIL